MSQHIDVIATTISGSIRDWGKVERIVPLFAEHGEHDVTLITADSHRAAREKTRERVQAGGRLLISAGGSGTFNSVLEGCHDAGEDLGSIKLGFLRKGSADLIGKVLDMPDDIESAVRVFVESIRQDTTVPCDILRAHSSNADTAPRHFVGYGGAEIFGAIPHYTENRFTKYYKGILSQLFGDLGPFFVGTNLAVIGKLLRQLRRGRRHWKIEVDGRVVSEGTYQAMIIVNGDLGPDLPFARDVPLGSGDFHVFLLRDLGCLKLPRQLQRAWSSKILENPARWGLEAFRVTEALVLHSQSAGVFPLNVDGSAMPCRNSVRITLAGQIALLARRHRAHQSVS